MTVYFFPFDFLLWMHRLFFNKCEFKTSQYYPLMSFAVIIHIPVLSISASCVLILAASFSLNSLFFIRNPYLYNAESATVISIPYMYALRGANLSQSCDGASSYNWSRIPSFLKLNILPDSAIYPSIKNDSHFYDCRNCTDHLIFLQILTEIVCLLKNLLI